MRYLLLLFLTGCAALGAEGTIKVNRDTAPYPKYVIPGKHHCDIGEEIECCCIKDNTGKVTNCTCVEK